MDALLNELAQDNAIPFEQAMQAVVKVFYRHTASHRPALRSV